jgi:hypothetical protein
MSNFLFKLIGVLVRTSLSFNRIRSSSVDSPSSGVSPEVDWKNYGYDFRKEFRFKLTLEVVSSPTELLRKRVKALEIQLGGQG